MKKHLIFVPIVLYALSLFFPYMKTVNLKTYELVSLSGFGHAEHHLIIFLSMLALLVTYFAVRGRFQKSSFVILGAFMAVALYQYTLLFHFDILAVVKGGLLGEYLKEIFSYLELGYYLSFALLIIFVVLALRDQVKQRG